MGTKDYGGLCGVYGIAYAPRLVSLDVGDVVRLCI